MKQKSVLVGTYNILKTEYDHTFKIYINWHESKDTGMSMDQIEKQVKESILRNIDGYTIVEKDR